MLLLTGLSAAAKAQAPDSSAKADGSPLRIRVAFSKSAQKRLHQRRVRRLLAIELDRIAPLDAGAAGLLQLRGRQRCLLGATMCKLRPRGSGIVLKPLRRARNAPRGPCTGR